MSGINRAKGWSVCPPVVTVRDRRVNDQVRHDRANVISEDAAGLLLYGILLQTAVDLAMLRSRGYWSADPSEMRGRFCQFHCNAGHVKIRGWDLLQTLDAPELCEWCQYLSAWLGRTIDREWIVRRAKEHNPRMWSRKTERGEVAA